MRALLPMLALGVVLARPAAADPVVNLDWEVTYGGLRVATFRFDERQDGSAYEIAFEGRTVGFAAMILPSHVTSSVAGVLDAGWPVPSLYESRSSGRFDRTARVTYHSGSAPSFEVSPKPGDDDEGAVTPIPPDSLPGTIDPLSSLLALSKTVDGAHGCAGRVRVFDGRRRYDLAIEPPGPNDTSDRSGPYRDLPALRCALHVVRIGGYPVEHSRRLANDNSVFWVADVPGLGRRVPVEIAFSGRWGVLRAHLLKPKAP